MSTVLEIPKELIELKTSAEGGGRENVVIYVSRICFIAEDMLKIVNEHQLECIFQIKESTKSGKKGNGSLELISVVKMDNMQDNFKRLDGNHLLVDPKVL